MMKKPPVVAVLGHIDHGKTSLLDAIRKTSAIKKEAGGITQSIGAYQVLTPHKRLITFIDTPGHAAFEKIRSHGAKAADIALLVIAADEGIKPQTLEALEDIRKSAIPFIVVLNKIDKPQANPEKVKQELASHEVMVEGWGGQVPVLEISALKGKGIKELLDIILLLADVEGLNVSKTSFAKGIVIASGMDSRRGATTTIIVKEGIFKIGDWVNVEGIYGKIRAMENFEGIKIKEAPPSTPALILGMKNVPEIGGQMVVASEKEVKNSILPEKLSDFQKRIVPDNAERVVKLILKARQEALLDAIGRVIKDAQKDFPDITLQFILQDVGDISTSDIDLASHFGAAIIGFQITANAKIKKLLKQKNVYYKLINVIYEIPDILKEITHARFAPQKSLEAYGELSVLTIYITSKKGQVIGGRVIKGVIKKNGVFEIKRQDSIIGKGNIKNLQQDKKDVSIVEKGKECGLLVQGEIPLQAGDVLVFS